MIYDVMEEDMHSDDDAGYSHSDEPDFDSWSDVPEVRTMANQPVYSELPRWLTDLRDGIEAPPAQQGIARQQRLAKMERDIADLADFIADCDRYAEFVPRLMGIHLLERRAQAIVKGRRLREELAILRRTP